MRREKNFAEKKFVKKFDKFCSVQYTTIESKKN